MFELESKFQSLRARVVHVLAMHPDLEECKSNELKDLIKYFVRKDYSKFTKSKKTMLKKLKEFDLQVE